MKIEFVDRCRTCNKAADTGQAVGDRCTNCERIHPADDWHRIIRVLRAGSRLVEIDAPAGERVAATGMLGGRHQLSRAFGIKDYANVKNADRAARKWLESA